MSRFMTLKQIYREEVRKCLVKKDKNTFEQKTLNYAGAQSQESQETSEKIPG